MQQLIAALGNDIKKSGKGWVARCKVHNDKDFAMSIKECENGSIVAHCFACGANGLDLYKALGLDLSELFGERESTHIPDNIRSQYQEDKFYIAIYESDINKGISPTLKDKRRMKLAKARTEGIKNKWGIIGLI